MLGNSFAGGTRVALSVGLFVVAAASSWSAISVGRLDGWGDSCAILVGGAGILLGFSLLLLSSLIWLALVLIILNPGIIYCILYRVDAPTSDTDWGVSPPPARPEATTAFGVTARSPKTRGLPSWAFACVVVACLVVGVALVANSWLAGQPYSQDQVDQAANTIGGPPGYSFDRAGSGGGGGFGQSEIQQQYVGTGTEETELTWALQRLLSLGFTNAQLSGSGVTASCGKLGVDIQANYLPSTGPPFAEAPPPVGFSGTSGVSLRVGSGGGSGASPNEPECPSGLLG